jgi:hypothetical protein
MYETADSPASSHWRDTSTLFSSAQGQSSNAAMPRKLVWIESQNFRGFGCTECQWVFKPAGALVGTSLDQMKQTYEAECNKEFAPHACAKFPRAISPKQE